MSLHYLLFALRHEPADMPKESLNIKRQSPTPRNPRRAAAAESAEHKVGKQWLPQRPV